MRFRLFLLAGLVALSPLAQADAPAAASASASASAPALAPTLAQLLASRTAAVVEVFTLRLSRQIDPWNFEPDWPFADEFALGKEASAALRPVVDPARDVASGILIGSDGLILTNAHVVSEVDEAQVLLADGRRFQARILGLDPDTDVALLKIEATGLPVAVIGDSSRVAVGDWVYAIGSPFGFRRSITGGIVSARDRLVAGAGKIPFLQTDVATNPGSSGGPLVNTRGEVIGLNSVIFSGSGGYMGVSFAVPINLAIQVAAQLARDGKVVHPHLGVEIQDVTPALAQAFRLPRPQGALVLRVEAASPAAAAGLEAGDVVLAFDDSDVGGVRELLQKIAGRAPGTRSQLRLWRRGAALSLPVTVTGRSSAPARPLARAVAPEWRHGLGLELAELSPAQLLQLRSENGLMVQESVGAARSEGIRSGDVIVAINDERIARLADFQRLLQRAAPGSVVALLVLRDTRLAYVAIRLPPRPQR